MTNVCFNFILKKYIDGGTGGYIYLGYLRNDTTGFDVTSRFNVAGGKGINKYGGSGGRIVLNFTVSDLLTIDQLQVGGGTSTNPNYRNNQTIIKLTYRAMCIWSCWYYF